MLLSRFPFLMRAVLALLLALAMAGAGAAHRPVERPAEAAAEFAAMAAFLAAGGSVDDLCLDGGMDGHERQDCPACVLQKVVLDVAQVAVPVLVSERLVPLWPVTQGQRLARDPLILPPARGPPETTFS